MPRPSHRPTCAQASCSAGSPVAAPASTPIDVRPSGRPVTLGSGGTQQRFFAGLGLPAADGAAPAANPGRVDEHVAGFAGVPSGA